MDVGDDFVRAEGPEPAEGQGLARGFQRAIELRDPTLQENIEVQLTQARKEVARLEKLKELLDKNPDISLTLDLLRMQRKY